LSDDFNTAQATKSIRHLISVTRSEISRAEINLNSNKTPQMLSGNGIGAVASVLNFVSKYFSSLGFNLTVSSEQNLHDIFFFTYL
jgi:hypothetical protein